MVLTFLDIVQRFYLFTLVYYARGISGKSYKRSCLISFSFFARKSKQAIYDYLVKYLSDLKKQGYRIAANDVSDSPIIRHQLKLLFSLFCKVK